MLNIITQFSKYLLVILTAVYAMKCFTVFRANMILTEVLFIWCRTF